MPNMMITAGLDIGNGYTKGSVGVADDKRTPIDIPSAMGRVRARLSDIKARPEEVPGIIKDLYNRADVSFDSPQVTDTSRFMMGRRAIEAGGLLKEFDVDSAKSKAEQELSYMLVFGCLACKALQEAYAANGGQLPADIVQADVYLALALPINEYKDYRTSYAQSFSQHTHIVSFHNFENPVRVQLRIVTTQVLAEGASAQYAINLKGEPLLTALMNRLTAMGEDLDGVTAADILQAKSTIGIDIGEGTVNFPVFIGGKFNQDASRTYPKGYGNVLTASLELLQASGLPFQSRKALGEFLMEPVTNLNKRKHAIVQPIVDDEISEFAEKIQMEFSGILARVGSYADVIYVYGGGSGPLADALYPRLIRASKEFGAGQATYPILYIEAEYARVLNREGLYLVAQNVRDSMLRTAQAANGAKRA